MFNEARRVLRDDGTVWCNLGDSYSGGGNYRGVNSLDTLSSKQRSNGGAQGLSQSLGAKSTGLPPKSLMMIPARFAIAMQDSGWILRSEIVWAKKNPMPESVTDRPTKSHEMIYMFAKSERYWYDQDAVRESHSRDWWKEFVGLEYMTPAEGRNDGGKRKGLGNPDGRNLRDVWHIASEPQQNEHYAAYPSELIEKPIKAGCPVGGVVCDFFMGSGTTALVAHRLGRDYIGCDLNADYVALANERLAQSDPFQHSTLPNGERQLSLFATLADDAK